MRICRSKKKADTNIFYTKIQIFELTEEFSINIQIKNVRNRISFESRQDHYDQE